MAATHGLVAVHLDNREPAEDVIETLRIEAADDDVRVIDTRPVPPAPAPGSPRLTG